MPRLDGMNPVLLKTLISLAASNNKPAKSGSLGDDAQLRGRTILYPDEALDLPEWGIAGMPGMVLGAAPQTCLFVSDMHISGASDDAHSSDTASSDNASTTNDSSDDQDKDAGEIVSFSLTLKCNPAPESNLKSCTIVWKLALPVAGYRDIQTSSNSASVRAPVIHTRMKIGGIMRDVEIGLLEMSGLEQPLLIGQDTLADKFLIRPDRTEKDRKVATPSVDLNPQKPVESPAPAAKDGSAPTTPATPATPAAPTPSSDSTDSTTTPQPAPDAPQQPVTPGATADATPTSTTAASPTTATTTPDTQSPPVTPTPDTAATPEAQQPPAAQPDSTPDASGASGASSTPATPGSNEQSQEPRSADTATSADSNNTQTSPAPVPATGTETPTTPDTTSTPEVTPQPATDTPDTSQDGSTNSDVSPDPKTAPTADSTEQTPNPV
ncbi:hypothetical protein [Thalassospira povalilytica]|uniref:Uncharacterized protein n=1 Tax=Thalassospira povalilytica TaxID=732237 RepID=A0ABX4R5E2_9PROT|nr:hypothetical protein [Thalassospira povalilytica]PKR47619.1 hypothetical protein CU041_18565 [Thalassospira povalilytica]